MNGDTEHSPTEADYDPIGFILDRWLARHAGLLSDGRAFRSRLRDAGQVEHGAIAIEAAAALEQGAAGTIEAARLLRAYAHRGNGPITRRDLTVAPRARRRWYAQPKIVGSAVTAVLGAAVWFVRWLLEHR